MVTMAARRYLGGSTLLFSVIEGASNARAFTTRRSG
jgi:hypothetical protein